MLLEALSFRSAPALCEKRYTSLGRFDLQAAPALHQEWGPNVALLSCGTDRASSLRNGLQEGLSMLNHRADECGYETLYRLIRLEAKSPSALPKNLDQSRTHQGWLVWKNDAIPAMSLSHRLFVCYLRFLPDPLPDRHPLLDW